MKMMTTTMKIYPIKKLTVLPTWETLSKLSSTEMKTRGKKNMKGQPYFSHLFNIL